MYKGFCVTFNRDVISYGVYFWTYYSLKDYLINTGIHNKLYLFIAGGFAGILSWLNCYPFDPIKTLIITSEEHITQYRAFKIIMKEKGVRGLFVGINPVILRAFIVHSTIFRVNEICRDFFIIE